MADAEVLAHLGDLRLWLTDAVQPGVDDQVLPDRDAVLEHVVRGREVDARQAGLSVLAQVDAHAGGEPGRVIVGGVLDVPGRSMFEKRLYLEQHADGLRKRMLREPRGYPGLCCNVILPPTSPEADAGFVIMEQTDYPPMSGSNTICVTTVLLETGMLPMREPVTELVLEAPAGLIRVTAECANGKVRSVGFRNVPSFVTQLDAKLEVPTLGTVTVDVAYGGMF